MSLQYLVFITLHYLCTNEVALIVRVYQIKDYINVGNITLLILERVGRSRQASISSVIYNSNRAYCKTLSNCRFRDTIQNYIATEIANYYLSNTLALTKPVRPPS